MPSYKIIGPNFLGLGQSPVISVVPSSSMTGTVTLTPSGCGLSTPITLTFTNGSVPKSVVLLPLSVGTLTLTASSTGGLTDPSPFLMTVASGQYNTVTSMAPLSSAHAGLTDLTVSISAFYNGVLTPVQSASSSGIVESLSGVSGDYIVQYNGNINTCYVFVWQSASAGLIYTDVVYHGEPITTSGNIDLGQAIPVAPVVGSLGEVFAGARASSLGRLVYDPIAKTFTVFAHDDSTVLKVLEVTTDSKGNVVSRV